MRKRYVDLQRKRRKECPVNEERTYALSQFLGRVWDANAMDLKNPSNLPVLLAKVLTLKENHIVMKFSKAFLEIKPLVMTFNVCLTWSARFV